MKICHMDDIYNSLIRVGDAVGMYKAEVSGSDPGYIASVKKLNNKMVDKWKSEVLNESSIDGAIPAMYVNPSLQVFQQGIFITRAMELIENEKMRSCSDETLRWWINFFETSSPVDMYNHTPMVVSRGWKIIETYLKSWYALEKWERLYKHFPLDPLAWDKQSGKFKDLFMGKERPIWNAGEFKPIQEKINSVFSTQLDFPMLKTRDVLDAKDFSRFLELRIIESDSKYTRSIKKLVNKNLKRWVDEVAPLLEKNGKIDPVIGWDSLMFFLEGVSVGKYIAMMDHFDIPSDEDVVWWKNFFEEKSVEELYMYGSATLDYGWNIVTTAIRDHIAKDKWENVYLLTEDPKEWESVRGKYEDRFPFWNKDKLSEIAQKVMAILHTPLEPRGLSGFD